MQFLTASKLSIGDLQVLAVVNFVGVKRCNVSWCPGGEVPQLAYTEVAHKCPSLH